MLLAKVTNTDTGNNQKSRVQENLAYIFTGTLVVAVAAYMVGKFFGIEIEIPVVLTTTISNILIFYFGVAAGRSKPES